MPLIDVSIPEAVTAPPPPQTNAIAGSCSCCITLPSGRAVWLEWDEHRIFKEDTIE